MAILQSGNLVFYHPLNSLTDGASVTWGGTPISAWSNPGPFVSGQIGNAMPANGGFVATGTDDGHPVSPRIVEG